MPRDCLDAAQAFARARRVAIIMLSAIGDAVHVLPVIHAIKRARPDIELSWVIQPVPHRLVHNHPDVHRFVIFRRPRGSALLPELWSTARRLRSYPVDLVLGLQVYLKAGILLAATRAPVKLGFDRRRARDGQWLFSTHRIPPHRPQHVQDQYLEFLKCLEVPADPVTWELPFTPEECEAREHYFAALDRPVCAVVVGTSKLEKNWMPERYARLLEALETDFGYRCVLVGGPSAAERSIADRILAETTSRPRDELGDDVRRLAYLLSGSRLVISPDTGPLHIARALGVPVVGLYGYTNPLRTGPYRCFEDLVVDGYAREPGEGYGVSMEYRPGGMNRITVDMVLERIQLARERYPGA